MGIQWDDSSFAAEDPEQSAVSGLTAYSGVPIEKEKMTQIEGWSYFVPTSSKKPELAWLFLQWAMGKDIQVAQMFLGGESGLRSTYEDEGVAQIPYVPTAVYLKTRGEIVLSVREHGAANGVGVPRRFLEAINPATGDTSVILVAKPTVPEEEQTTEAIMLYVNRAIQQELTPQQALDELAAEMERILPK
jgi:ABC-type glycerol-3-phosphate transport system substrate-binding protein